ncbi:MAG TPA: VOC family protein [Acidimicrobiia bacterium]|nr:VOC family protein [Acidimicrobiia bacterium]
MSARVHHSAIVVRDVDASLRFWRDGIGLTVIMDQAFDGDWRTLFRASTDQLRSIFLGDPGHADAGIVELVQFADGARPRDREAGSPREGFLLLSIYVDIEPVLRRLETLGLGGPPRRITVPGPAGPVAMATVVDPDGVLVELIGA